MTQPTMEGINTATPNSGTPLDLRTPEAEEAKAKAAAIKASQLAEQNKAAVGSPVGLDGVTPAPAPDTAPTSAPDTAPIATPDPGPAVPIETPQPTKKPGFFGKLFRKK